MDEASAFVGRRDVIDAIAQRLADGERILTITGTGGIGKTRLARHMIARGLPGVAADRVWFCDLTEARDAIGICAAVARAIEATIAAADPGQAPDEVGRALAERGRALVVLDNFEQVVGHATATVATWVTMAPAASFLVTSRERLRIAGENAFELPPLDVSAPGGDDAGSEAVKLLVDRVRRVRGEWEPSSRDAPVLAEIVRRLDGIPLAIELCAARANMLAPVQLLERLSKRLELLGAGPRSAATRHATLRGAIDWSWELLDPEEARALCACSVFHGGFDLAAAEAVLESGGRAPIDLVQALRDKSLLVAARAAQTPDEMRLSMFESVREYALEKLRAAGMEVEAFRRHADYFVDTGGRWARRVWSHGGMDVLRRLAVERGNVVAVLERVLARADRTAESAAHALGAVSALEPLFTMGEPAGLVVSLCDSALEYAADVERATGHAADAASTATALLARARGHRILGRFEHAARDCSRARDLAASRGDLRGEALALLGLGELAFDRGLPADARGPFERALPLLGGLDEPRLEGLVRTRLAGIAGVAGRIDEALAHVNAGAVLLRRAGDRRGEITAEHMLGWLSSEAGDAARARAHCNTALKLSEEVGGRSSQPAILRTLALVEHEAGHAREAEAFYERATSVARSLGAKNHVGILTADLALLLHEHGRLDDAIACLENAIATLGELDQRPAQAVSEAALGAILARRGDAAGAARLLDAADATLGPSDDPLRTSILRVQRGHLDLALAARAAARGDDAGARAHRDAARRRIAAVGPLAACFLEVRLAVRVLRHALEAAEGPPDALLVAHDGAWFRPPRGEIVDVHRRATLRRLLVALVEMRLGAPGTPMLLAQLCAETWPGEAVARDAAANRAYVAINGLRSMGLKAVLLSADQGWLLDPAVPVYRALSKPGGS